MTHSDMSEEDLDRCGISDSDGSVVGSDLESSDDLIEDLMAALKGWFDNETLRKEQIFFMTGAIRARRAETFSKNGQDADLRKR